MKPRHLLAVALCALVLPCAAFAAPAGLVYFDQPASAQIFAQAAAKKNFWPLSRYYETQRIDTFCSVTSSTMVPRVPNIAGDGLTLAELSDILKTFGVSVERRYAASTSAVEFRRLAQSALASDERYVIVNFLRSALGQEGGGHFSPLGAYNAVTDRFLVLDTARYKYPPFWVAPDDLWAAMSTQDASAKAQRGFLIVGRAPG